MQEMAFHIITNRTGDGSNKW